MFDEMRSAINVADAVINQFSFDKDITVERLEQLRKKEDIDDYDKDAIKDYVSRLELYEEIEKTIMKWVKSKM